MIHFGDYVRQKRESLRLSDKGFSLRQVAQRVGIQAAYLSKIERNEVSPPSEATIIRLANEINENPDQLLALAGKVSQALRQIILNRPQIFADLLKILENAPDSTIRQFIKVVKNKES